MSKQLKRWSHGFVQNVRLHWKGILPLRLPEHRGRRRVLRRRGRFADLPVRAARSWRSSCSAPWILLVYVIDVPAVIVPVLVAAWRRGEVVRALVSLPCFFVLRTVNGFFMLEAIVTEVVLRRPLLVYEKGH